MNVDAIKEEIQRLSKTEQSKLADWLDQEIPSDIDAKIAAGLRQLEDGEGIPGDVSSSRLQVRKAAWLAHEQSRT